MKKISTLIFGLTALLFVNSCEEPDQDVFGAVTAQDVIDSTNPNVPQVIVASAYSSVVGTWGGHNGLWSLHEVSSDEMVIAHKGADWEDGGQWIRVHRHDMLPSEEAINNGWTYLYGIVAQVNNTLASFGAEGAVGAELVALRALAYLWLLDAYGNVPIIIETTTDPSPATNTRQEVFNFVEQSLRTALPELTEEVTVITKSRMTAWAAQAALAKLYLNAEVYTGTAMLSEAEAAVDALINSGQFSLESNFFSNFATENATSSENIFTISYDELTGTGFNLVQMTLHYSSQQTFNLQEQPWNGYASLEDFYNSFDPTDARINSFIEGPQFDANGEVLIDLSAEAGDPDGQPINFTPAINELTPGSLRQAGARVGKFEFKSGAAQSLSNDFPIFRYGDILLMKAEIQWRNGNAAGALEFVNQVRQRAGIDPLVTLDADILLAERGREVFAEGYRRSDLIRFGKFNDSWWEKGISDATKQLFPIPTPQIQANPNLIQNMGY